VAATHATRKRYNVVSLAMNVQPRGALPKREVFNDETGKGDLGTFVIVF
jgi:hypothetical protein